MKKGSITQSFTLICYFVALAAAMVFSLLFDALHGDKQIGDAAYIYASYFAPQACYLLSITVFALVKRVPAGDFFQPKNIRPFPYVYTLLIALGLFCAAILPNVYLQKAFDAAGNRSSVVLPPLETASEIVLTILFICILPAIGEEMLFRKTFCEGMKGNNEWMIILLGGLFFSLSHFNLVQTIHQFVLGSVLCFLYLRTRNITLTMLMHFLNNLLAIFIKEWTGSAVNWNSVLVLGVVFAIGLVLLGAGMYLAIRYTKKTEDEGAKPEAYTIALLAATAIIWTASVAAGFLSLTERR